MTFPESPTTPPTWVAAPHPWEQSATADPSHVVEHQAGPKHRNGVGLAAAMAALGLLSGIGLGGLVGRHGIRPALSALTGPATSSSAVPDRSLPVVPGSRDLPGSPSTGSGSSATGGGSAAIAALVTPGIVDINTTDHYAGAIGAGTGMILTSTGEILTNNHVVEGSTAISVTSVATGRTYRATVVGTDPTQDVAVLQLSGANGLTPIRLGSATSVAVGDAVVAIGNAGGAGGAPAVVTGTVRATDQTITASDMGGANPETLSGLIQTDAPIQPGDSGGPLVTTAGRVIGMDTAASVGRRLGSGESVGFAIPIDHAVAVAKQIEGGQASATIHIGLPGFLGVSVSPAAGPGAVVAAVVPGFPAGTAGVRAGDTITAIDGHPVESAQTLSTLTRAHKPGERISMTWTDQGGAAHTAAVTLGTGPAD